MEKRLRLACFVVLLLLSKSGQAKKTYHATQHAQPKSFIELDGYGGMIFKHTTRFTVPVNQPSYMCEFTYARTLTGKHIFERSFGYPLLGGSFIFAYFGNHAYFGNAYGALPHLTFWIKRTPKIDVYFRMGIGLAWLSSPYDYYKNPLNNVIGSHLNNMTQVRWGLNYKVSEVSNINAGINVTHISNAHSQNPNLGINYFALSLGYRYNLGMGKAVLQTDSIPPLQKKNYFITGVSMGVLEQGKVPNGPTTNSYSAYFQYQRATGHTNQLIAGLNLEFNEMNFKETVYRENNESSIERKTINAMNAGVVVGDELIFNRVGFMMQIGVYVFRPYYKDKWMYQKAGLNYYFPLGKDAKTSLFTGVNVKLHMSVAESLEFRGGVRF